MTQKSYWFIGIICFLFSGCSLTRSLPEGEYLYRGAKVKIITEDKQVDTKTLQNEYNLITKNPKLNKRFLGIRLKLRFHNWFHTKKQKGLFHSLQQKWGEPPVTYNPQITKQVEKVLANKAFNNGFFNVEVSSEVRKKRKKAKIKYLVRIKKPFEIGQIENKIADSLVLKKVGEAQTGTLLKTGDVYQLDLLKQERVRLANALRAEGLYFFRDNFLLFEADTTQATGKVHLSLHLKEFIDSLDLIPYKINEIVVRIQSPQSKSNTKSDTLTFQELQLIQPTTIIRPSTIRDAIALKSGGNYDPNQHQETLKGLSNLKLFQFIELQFKRSQKQANVLDARIELTPRKKYSIEGALGLSYKPRLSFGPELSLSWLNRNVFKRAEQLRWTAFGNYNIALNDDLATLQKQGLTMEFTKPGIFLPFRKKRNSKLLRSRTKFQAEYKNEATKFPLKGSLDFLEMNGLNDLAERLAADSTFAPKIALNNFEVSLGIQWQKRLRFQQELNPLNFTIQTPRYEFDQLRNLLITVGLISDELEGIIVNLEKMLIFKPNYILTYDSRAKGIKKHNAYYRMKLAVASNWLLGKDNLIPSEFLEGQFLQIENDFRYFLHQGKQTIGWRMAINIAIPVKNEAVLPFFDLYNIGGQSSVRAFRPRLVGPGSIEPADELLFFTGVGDVLLESNLEWRLKLSKLFELALFVDAGNVWLLNGSEEEEDLGVFKWSDFYKQLAIGTGLGFRFDFSVLLLRLDIAFPLTKPWEPEGQRWVGNKISLGSQTWRQENLVFNLGFGYPF